tara:strand:- start:16 stop:513 length:498 start_codon:yes stop_codon:yes gene_type:complete
MPVFSQNVITQVAGFDSPLLTGELVYNQQTYWNLALKTTATLPATPINITGATISAQIVRRTVTNLQDTRTGLSFDIGNYSPTPTTVTLTIANRVDVSGTFTVVLDETAWSVIAGDPDLQIDKIDPVCFSGRVKVSFPAAGGTPQDDLIIFLMFLVRSDGIINIS